MIIVLRGHTTYCFLLLASCFLLLASCFLLLACSTSCFLLLASCFLIRALDILSFQLIRIALLTSAAVRKPKVLYRYVVLFVVSRSCTRHHKVGDPRDHCVAAFSDAPHLFTSALAAGITRSSYRFIQAEFANQIGLQLLISILVRIVILNINV